MRFLRLTTLCLTLIGGSASAQSIDTPPTTPGNPTARAYGPTSGGVAWQRSSDDRRVVGYEITRDGTVLGVRDTLSYVAEDLAPGRGYNFAIVAIDSAGQRSGRALARIETPDARPDRPSGLTANVYSATAAGIRWDRSGVFGERHEVKRDGRIAVAATNGTSYVDTTLSPARPVYLYEVIAVNRQGQRSAAARVFVDTREGASGPSAAGPAAPDGLRAVTYSATAGAIAWERAATTGLRYEISRDGEVVATTRGTSYVDDALAGGTSYAYGVVAIDRQGRRSAASTAMLGTGGSDGSAGSPDEGGEGPSAPSLQPVQAALELVPDKTFRIGWEPSAGAELYRVLENPDGVSGFTPISGELKPSTRRLDHRVALHRRVNARYIVQACDGGGCADSDELVVSGSLESAVGYFKASNTDPNDFFGVAVSVSDDGNTLVVGARGEGSAASGVNGDQEDNSLFRSFPDGYGAGAVYVFARTGGTWRQQAYLKGESAGEEDLFGSAVSLSATGDRLAVGATGGAVRSNRNTVGAGFRGGSTAGVYTFVRSEGNWRQEANLPPTGDGFGFAVSLSGDGETLAVGSIFEDARLPDDVRGAGATYVYVLGEEGWEEQAFLKAGAPLAPLENLHFGYAVSLSGDGDTLAIGAFGGFPHSGAAYVFARSEGNWRQQAYLESREVGSVFGSVLSLSDDGDTLAVGAPREDGGTAESGAVHLFAREDDGWRQQAYLRASNVDAYDYFGTAVSLSGDGNLLAVGAPEEQSTASGLNGSEGNSRSKPGAVYLFERGSGDWRQSAFVKASNNDPAAVALDEPEDFGAAVALSVDGDTLAVGAIGEDSAATGIGGDQQDDSADVAGAVYLY